MPISSTTYRVCSRVVIFCSAGMLQLYHISKFRSTRVVWTLGELAQIVKVPSVRVHEFVDVGSFRSEKADWFLKMNPNGKIPVLVDEKTTLFESCAIVLSLLDRFDDGRLLPRDQRDLFYQLAFYASGTIDNVTSTSSPIQLAENIVHGVESAAKMKPTVDVVRKTAWTDVIAPFLESQIQHDGPYFAGDRFTAIDIVLGLDLFAMDERLIKRGSSDDSWIKEESTPKLRRLADLLMERPARAFAFEASLLTPGSLDSKHDFGITDWIHARDPTHSTS